MRDSVKGYFSLASGAARQLVNQGGSTAGQVQAMAGDVVSSSRSNRAALVGLIRYEIDRALGRLGLASVDEVAALRARVRTLEVQVRELAVSSAKPATGSGATARASSRKTPAAK